MIYLQQGLSGLTLVALAFIAGCRNDDPGETEAIAHIKKLGGDYVRLEKDDSGDGQLSVHVSLPRSTVDEDLKKIKLLKSITWLQLENSQITDAGLKEIADLPNLLELDLTNTKITDAGLKEIKRMKSLRGLRLDETSITDAGLNELSDCTSIQLLGLTATQISDSGLNALARLTKLQILSLTDTRVTDKGIEIVGENLKQIYSFHVARCNVLPNAGLRKSRNYNHSHCLESMAPRLRMRGLDELKSLKELRYVGMSELHVSDAKIAELEKELPNCKFNR